MFKDYFLIFGIYENGLTECSMQRKFIFDQDLSNLIKLVFFLSRKYPESWLIRKFYQLLKNKITNVLGEAISFLVISDELCRDHGKIKKAFENITHFKTRSKK